MRAVRVHELVGPSGLRVDDMPEPQPGPGEVRIAVRAAGVNFPDVLFSYGKYQFKPPPPFVPGLEAAGVVAAVGDGVTAVAVGDRVATTLVHGAFAEQLVVPATAAVKLPAAVGFELAAATLLTYGTTWHALVDRAGLKAGETLLVLGAAGGVGIAAVEIGKLLGARVIAAASTAEKLKFCREHGADEGIEYTREDLKERSKQLTGGEGVDVVYDAVGGPFAEPALRAIAWQGRYLVVGFAAGEIPKIPLNLVLLKGCQLVGVFWGAFAAREPAKNHANAERILAAVAAGQLRPHVDATLPFARAGEALTRMERREVLGKLVLVP
ncbi:NADPH:quinone oxidoreductase family protein [Nannocystis punicea]|uniref:NADPH:quinone oxidoreductase family protein n=1 Tax=Nannocystis punicea TaxID=2995304 RepID=A0ABY7HBZ4_9BACT|nr:NADPH:quinone oxidoreductase family protein [Nannocystis poenicansa]WAS96794.1 NADPH:quinone oxidoreductase family protein [Nannocystis poenicansa]